MFRSLALFLGLVISLAFGFVATANAQFTLQCTSPWSTAGGSDLLWLSWNQPARNVVQDTAGIMVMSDLCALTVEYTYTFTANERAGWFRSLSSTFHDLNNNGTFEVMLMYGGNGQIGLKIFDITTGQVLFERNDPGMTIDCTYVYIEDVDADGLLELVPTCKRYNK
jgi:hypothetical protein